jgi:hypothetical protein
MGPTDKQVLDSFWSQALDAKQVTRVERVRVACRDAAAVMLENCPPSADRTAAFRKLHEAMMTANKSIALENA